jgi:hypothetical protein
MSTPEGAFGDFIRTATSTVRGNEEIGAKRLREAAAGLRGAMAAMFSEVIRATDPHGYVEAAVDLRGRLQEVNISAYAMRDLDAARLSQTCLEAYQAAKRVAGEAIAERFTDLLGMRPGEASFEDAIPAEMRSWAEVEEIRRAAR